MVIDLRSDTLTKPTLAMRQAMAEAEVGDDVYGEDPTVNLLQEKAAKIMGKEAALFVPSGSMGNCVALLSHTTPGAEVICEAHSHVYNFEMASMSVFGGLLPRVIKGSGGRMAPQDIEAAIRPHIYYLSQTGLICIENTHNMAGGTLLDIPYLQSVREIAQKYNLPIHMDGARIFNAATALGVDAGEIAKYADSVMFCLSKGLCAPVGSLIVGSKEFIERARVHRKRLGGGMRQVGVIAAAGLVALEEIPPLLLEDHKKIKKYVDLFSKYDFIKFNSEEVKTNIFIFRIEHHNLSAKNLGDHLARRGVLCHVLGDSIRFVTYRDITNEMVDESIVILKDIFKKYF